MVRIRVLGFSLYLAVVLIIIQVSVAHGTIKLNSEKLCSQCSKCEASQCPPSESYPHMTTFDDSLIASALQSDHVGIGDRGVYSVPNVIGGVSTNSNSYYGWKSTSGSESGYHRFSNYMDKCSEGQTYLSVDKKGKVAIPNWKSINPPSNLNHREVRFWVSHSTGKCLTVLGGKNKLKRVLGLTECRFDGSNLNQLFAFRFHYHKAFCCCGIFNN
ncbi:hypothetical protein MKX01_030744 [Papaver californicum]|nr:hypothetical protein MKX01_030744 [Papaver californicum]